MLSLPLTPPQPDILPNRNNFHPRSDSPPPPQANGRQNQQHQHRQQPQSRREEAEKKAQNARSPLALLAADEAAIAARKAAIRNFGAYWIRPPGVSKTLQAMTEEAAEIAEQEEAIRQEQGLRDMQAQQQLEEARTRAAEMGEQGGEDEEEERDLDAEIPDADDAEDGEDGGADVTFNEDSMVEGSRVEVDAEHYVMLEEAELTGAARDEEDLGIERDMDMERDLDNSVPEAGSYQHTDTEVEDSTSESELNDSFANMPSTRRSTRSSARQPDQTNMSGALPAGLHGGLQERIRAQTTAGGGDASLARSPGGLNLSSSLLESSFVGSSPVVQRGGRGRAAGNGGQGRRRGGRLS